MTRDYKPVSRRQKTAGKGSIFFTGFLFGLIVGVGASVAVAWFVKGGDSPFSVPERAPRVDTAPASGADATPPADDPSRFDFYKILPNNENPVPEQEAQPRQAEQMPVPPAGAAESYYLQVGAFHSEQDADNLKAQLALLGMEALVQTVEVPGKGNLHRVRVGPYASLDQIARARTALTQNGFSAELVKFPNP